MTKIGLVVEGGGMKCAYSAGVLDKFLDDQVTFEYVIGASAGCANAASYLAGQRGRNRRFYTTHIHEKGYFGFDSLLKTHDLFGLDYIYSTLTNSNGGDPLDWPAIVANPAAFEVVATNAVTGDPRYFRKEEMRQDDYQMIKASCALPAACRPRIIDGVPYYDGGMSDPLPVDRAFLQGCDKVVVITSKPRTYMKKKERPRILYTLRLLRYPKMIEMLNNRHIRYMADFRHVFDLEKQGKVFVFAPSKTLDMSTFAMNAEDNQALYDLGIADYEQLAAELKKFMKK